MCARRRERRHAAQQSRAQHGAARHREPSGTRLRRDHAQQHGQAHRRRHRMKPRKDEQTHRPRRRRRPCRRLHDSYEVGNEQCMRNDGTVCNAASDTGSARGRARAAPCAPCRTKCAARLTHRSAQHQPPPRRRHRLHRGCGGQRAHRGRTTRVAGSQAASTARAAQRRRAARSNECGTARHARSPRTTDSKVARHHAALSGAHTRCGTATHPLLAKGAAP